MAEQVLFYLSGEPELLAQFLTDSGMAPQDIRSALMQAESCVALLDFIAQDDRRLVAFAQQAQIRPEDVMRLRTTLAGPGSYGWEAD